MTIQDRVLRIWGIKECGDGELCAGCNRAREEFERFAEEIKKRCAEECEKEKMEADNDQGVLTEYEQGYNQACEDCKQAILNMRIE